MKDLDVPVYKARCPLCGAEFYATSEQDAKIKLEAHLAVHDTGRGGREQAGEGQAEEAEGS